MTDVETCSNSCSSPEADETVCVDFDPDVTDDELKRYGLTRRLAVLRGGKIVEITGAPERETR